MLEINNETLSFYWSLTQLVKETTCKSDVEKFLHYNNLEYEVNIFETSKDEVLQIYNGDECYTIVGGSSGDRKEWRSNFNTGKLVYGNIHKGFYTLAMEVLHHKRFIKRKKMMCCGHSRGGAGVAVMCYLRKEYTGVVFGSPKPFKNWIDFKGRLVCVENKLDPVTWVVPTFKKVGVLVRLCFARRAHTGYGRHLHKIREVIAS